MFGGVVFDIDDPLTAWRARVSRWSVVTMAAALIVFVLSAALKLPTYAEVGLFAILAGIVVRWVMVLRDGRCPGCGARIRMEPRLVVPTRCAACGKWLGATENADH